MNIPDDVLIELVEIANTPWGDSPLYTATPPTPSSIRRIEEQLGITLPRSLLQIASSDRNYGGWFASIGTDYQSHMHILKLNETFRHSWEGEPPLPVHFVLFNHGHDGDCDCWDTTSKNADGEPEIIYIPMESDHPEVKKRWPSFDAYMRDYVLDHAGKHHDQRLRERANELLNQLGLRLS